MDCDGGLFGQRLISRFCSVHLQDTGGYSHNVVVIGEPGLLKRN
jgi:hypothetical protein